jgi:DNA polymerase III epsilon subunit-like protein
MNIVFCDFETGGLDPKEGAEPIELAAILLDENFVEISRFPARLMKVNKTENLNPEALLVNKKTVKQICNGEEPAIVFIDFVNWLRKHGGVKRVMFAAHNAAFDKEFMALGLDKYVAGVTYDKLFQHKKICTVELTNFIKGLVQKAVPNAKLETITRHYGIEYEAHTAMGDVEAGVQVLRRLMSEIKPLEHPSIDSSTDTPLP